MMTALPKKKPPLATAKEEESKPVPLKPNFRIKNTNINDSPDQYNPFEQNRKKAPGREISEDLREPETEEIGRNPVRSIQEPGKKPNIYEKAGLKPSPKPQDSKFQNTPEMISKNQNFNREENLGGKQAIFKDDKPKFTEKGPLMPMRPKPVQKSIDNDSIFDSNPKEIPQKPVLPRKNEPKEEQKIKKPLVVAKKQELEDESEDEEELKLEPQPKKKEAVEEKKPKKNNENDIKREEQQVVPPVKKEEKPKPKEEDNGDDYADDFNEYEQEFDDFDDEEPEPKPKAEKVQKEEKIEKNPKSIPSKEKEIIAKSSKQELDKNSNDSIKKPDFKKKLVFSPEKSMENTSSVLANTNNKALNQGQNYKKPFQKISYSTVEKQDERKINLERRESGKLKEISSHKEELQHKRIKEFKPLIEMDVYEELLDIHPCCKILIYTYYKFIL